MRASAKQSQTSDLILMILDATKKAEQRALIEAELEAVGIRLNREPPLVFLFQPVFPLPSDGLMQQYLPQSQESWWDENHFPEST